MGKIIISCLGLVLFLKESSQAEHTASPSPFAPGATAASRHAVRCGPERSCPGSLPCQTTEESASLDVWRFLAFPPAQTRLWARCCKSKNQQRVTLALTPGCQARRAPRPLTGSAGAGGRRSPAPGRGLATAGGRGGRRASSARLPSGAALPGGILASLASHFCDTGTRQLPTPPPPPPPRIAAATPQPLLPVRRIPPRSGLPHLAEKAPFSRQPARPPTPPLPLRHLLPQPAR